jgi:hypothetical protein
MRAKNNRSEWSKKHTPGVSDPPPERSDSDDDKAPKIPLRNRLMERWRSNPEYKGPFVA